MKIGVFQFASTDSVNHNFAKMQKAIAQAAHDGVRLLVFHECSLCGYPPVEAEIGKIDFAAIDNALARICEMAKQYTIYIAVGTVRLAGSKRYNSVVLIDDKGEIAGYYDKKALWGWDTDNFARGCNSGVFTVDGITVGFRICFDVRFPEPFRELYEKNTDLCFVCFSDTADEPSQSRYNTIKSHLVTRAVENVMTVVSANSISRFQTAPSAVIDCNGTVVSECEVSKEQILVYDYVKPESSFGMRGRRENSDYFMHICGEFCD